MNFWNDRELALRFKNNQVPSKERFWYLLITLVLLDLITFTFFNQKNCNKWDTYIDIAGLLFTIIGTFVCYNTNKSGDDKEFIERYICLVIPILARTFLLCIPLALIMEIILRNDFQLTSVFTLICVSIMLSYFTWRLNSAIKIASH
jgi:hypothetical protein